MSHAALMDSIYRYQQPVYDLTRAWFLLGRDRMLDAMDIRAGDRVLEVGCGTGRNLLALARRYPHARLHGLDISGVMLETARKKLARAGREDIPLARCAAESLHPDTTFAGGGPFDAILFSYALSMIPPWREALRAALGSVAPGGAVYIVDFWDQGDLPGVFRSVLVRWLSLFHVRHEPELLAYLRDLHRAGACRLTLSPHRLRYAYLATLTDIRLESFETSCV